MASSIDYLLNPRIYCVDCVIADKFFTGWIAIISFTQPIETLFDEADQPVVSIVIPKELRRVDTIQVFFDRNERIEFDIANEPIRTA